MFSSGCRPRLKNERADTSAILISIVSNSYYGMPRVQIRINLSPVHPAMSFETIEIKMAAVSVKRCMNCKIEIVVILG